MVKLLRLLISEPLALFAVFASFSIIGGRLVSDWAKKRRQRKLLPPSRVSDASESALASTLQNQPKPLFRLFRWEFLLVAIAIAAIILLRKGSQPDDSAPGVVAKTPPVAPASKAPSEAITAGNFAEYSLSLRTDAARTNDQMADGILETGGPISSSLALNAKEDDLRGSDLAAILAGGREASETISLAAPDTDGTNSSFLEGIGATAADYYPIETRPTFTSKSTSPGMPAW